MIDHRIFADQISLLGRQIRETSPHAAIVLFTLAGALLSHKSRPQDLHYLADMSAKLAKRFQEETLPGDRN